MSGAGADSLAVSGDIRSFGYRYDSSGNLLYDARKGLQFNYNMLNLPSVVTLSSGSEMNRSVTYSYLSDGTKVAAITSDGSGRLYRGSFVYCSLP